MINAKNAIDARLQQYDILVGTARLQEPLSSVSTDTLETQIRTTISSLVIFCDQKTIGIKPIENGEKESRKIPVVDLRVFRSLFIKFPLAYTVTIIIDELIKCCSLSAFDSAVEIGVFFLTLPSKDHIKTYSLRETFLSMAKESFLRDLKNENTDDIARELILSIAERLKM